MSTFWPQIGLCAHTTSTGTMQKRREIEHRPFYSRSINAQLWGLGDGKSLLDMSSWRLSWCTGIRYESKGKRDQTALKLLSSDSGAGANRAAGCGEATGTNKRLCRSQTWYHRLVWEKRGSQYPKLCSTPPRSLHQMVKSTGTAFSFPPKLDKLKSNELVRGKIKSSALLSKK